MQILLVVLIMSVFSFPLVVTVARAEKQREGFLGLMAWQSPDEKEAPVAVMPEQLAQRLAHLHPKLSKAIRSMEKRDQILDFLRSAKWCRESGSPYCPRSILSPKEEQLFEEVEQVFQRRDELDIQDTLAQVSDVMLQAAVMLEMWRAYLQKTQMLSKLQRLAEPEVTAQQATALRESLERVSWTGVEAKNKQELNTLQHELSLMADLIGQEGKRD